MSNVLIVESKTICPGVYLLKSFLYLQMKIILEVFCLLPKDYFVFFIIVISEFTQCYIISRDIRNKIGQSISKGKNTTDIDKQILVITDHVHLVQFSNNRTRKAKKE